MSGVLNLCVAEKNEEEMEAISQVEKTCTNGVDVSIAIPARAERLASYSFARI